MDGKGERPVWRNILITVLIRGVMGCVGLALTLGALFFLTHPINVIAYYLGYGEEMRVEVIEAGRGDSSFGRGAEPGQARVLGEDRTVGVFETSVGDVVIARPRLLDLGAAEMRYAYTGHASVLPGLTSIFGVLVLGFPGLLLLIGGFGPKFVLVRFTPLLNRFNAWAVKKSGQPQRER
ncbi:hypothetical protein IU448_14670 [Nocardia flavorosea]|uniref:hypothetical protein n=1 Tax=Nocardia flavorosea TaxID=53429 RepID=UPI001895B03A|nr:hypothetical protein [Nocardia flavorosea]MBF6350251.1 hypothetical protein [Nocardia flavorosea]